MADESVYFESKEFKNILKQYEESVKSGHPAYMDADDLADIADCSIRQERLWPRTTTKPPMSIRHASRLSTVRRVSISKEKS